ncbi:hypothetical protein GWK08_08335 [Leptobacterium flavescens]|uniref:Calcineurin-like phosphoesterase domain-containing protein n=1 Tax=Leptobacterium flavescens TaxID=472055 RepID=A0A6P0ULY2_9FLAO|nr:metallophosphoesterase [Leptobacterium flavescens]NER13440.1 hypothetical protein [Leptobacterium flavescens]
MKTKLLRYFKHLFLTILVLGITAVLIGLYMGASLNYADRPGKWNMEKEGPYVFFENDSVLSVNHIRGNRDKGFYVDKKEYPIGSEIEATSYFSLDATDFNFSLKTDFKTPKTTYDDGNKILAISDIESGYKTFRDFLINSKVIDAELNWTFGNGHLVLVGDFVDRGFSTTQVLWFIYKLEQEAQKKGGMVHFILGNHELKNLQGNYGAASDKYLAVSNILEKQQFELYNSDSFIGRWLSSKNTVERINGNLFTHGGLHPDLADTNISLEQLNETVRKNYYKAYYPKATKSTEQMLVSTRIGPSWYRGYFRENLTQEEVERGLDKFDAKAVIVGHTIQRKVNRKFQGKVIGIDVHHPKDYSKSWPKRRSEALMIEGGKYYRVFDNGGRREML